MKKTLAILLIVSITSITPYTGMEVQALAATPTAAGPPQEYWDVQFSMEQLENLVAPIALYPDPLLAQVLLAATFPDQIDEAARQVRAYGSGYNIDSMYWDVSVKAVAHYPPVLSMMADKLDWTISLGQAYVNQSTDLMQAVQRLRRRARAAGYLVTTAQQEIVDTGGYLYIYPAQAQYIYVPTYDPAVVFVERAGFHWGTAIWFGAGLLIGAWLNHDCDWDHHNVYYHGWSGGPRWIARSRPHVRINNYYVNNSYRNVVANRNVVNRNVNYGALNRYNTVNRNVDYNNVRRQRGAAGARQAPAQPAQAQPTTRRPDNSIIRRNIDPNDPRIDAHRGRGQWPQARQPQAQQPQAQQPQVTQPQAQRPGARRPETRQPQAQQPQVQQPQITQPQAQQPQARQPRGQRPEGRQPQTQQPQAPRTPATTLPAQVPRAAPPVTTLPAQVPRAPQAQPAQQQRQPAVQRQPESVFRGGSGTFDPRAASQRGQFSRQQPARPAPAAQPVQRQQAPAAQRAPRQQAPAAQPAPRQQAPAAQRAPRQQAPAAQPAPRQQAPAAQPAPRQQAPPGQQKPRGRGPK